MTCSHCLHDEVRRNGLCQPCSLYRRRTGRLPSQKVLYDRAAMRERRTEELVGWVIELGPELTQTLARLYAEERAGAA